MYTWTVNMKRTITIAMALTIFSASVSFAIDAKKKSGTAAPTAAAPSDSVRDTTVHAKHSHASSKALLDRLKMDVRESSKSSDSGKYDNYIDANNDGVDDRVKTRPAQAETVNMRQKASTPVNDDGVRVRVKKKPR